MEGSSVVLKEPIETKNDDLGRILIFYIKICDKELLLDNLYNANQTLKKSR